MVNVAKAGELLASLALMKFFPADKEARTALVGMVCEMAADDEQVRWLVRRMLALYNEWPGPRELRACFCARYKPRDGIEARSEKFLEGIPPERKPAPVLALPPGPQMTATREIDAAVGALAPAKTVPHPRRPITPPDSTRAVITQADIDAAVRRNRDRQARADRGAGDVE